MRKLFNHIAVILRGHMRTWEFVKDSNFKFYDNLADNVDYYLATWDIQEYNKDKIKNSFPNLIKAVFLSTDTIYYTGTSLTCGWLTTNIIPFKKEREKHVTYDAIFETRPDVIYRIEEEKSRFQLEPNTFYTIRSREENTRLGPSLFMEDYFWIMSSDCFDTISPRYFEQDLFCNTQVSISNVIKNRGFQIQNIHWIEPVIVRPTLPGNGYTAEDFLDSTKNLVEYNYDRWISLSNDEKINMCHNLGVSPEDYKCSGSGVIKIY